MLFRHQSEIFSCTHKLLRNPHDVLAYQERSNAWIKMQAFDKAIFDLNQAIKINSRDAKLYYNRGLAYVGLKNYQQAISDWSQAILLDPQYASAYQNRGQTYAILEQSDRAREDFEQALKINPNYALVYRNRALLYYSLRKYKQAIADYQKSIQLETNNDLAIYNQKILIALLEKESNARKNCQLAGATNKQDNSNDKPIKKNRIWLTNKLNLGVIAGAVVFVLLAPLVNSVFSEEESESFQFVAPVEFTKTLVEAPVIAMPPENKQEFLVASEAVKTFKEVEGVPSGLFYYGGSTSWAPIRSQVDSLIQAHKPEFKLSYHQHPVLMANSSLGIEMLLNDQLTIAQSSRPLKVQEYQLAQEQNLTLKQIPIAIDGIAIAVHPSLNIPGLTLAQLQDIYTGKIINWQQVGGPNLEIIPYSKSPYLSGTAEFFVKHVMNKKILGSNVRLVRSVTEGIQDVASQQGSIFYTSASEIVGQCTVKPLPIGDNQNNLIPPYIEPLVPPEQCPERRNQINHQAFQAEQYPLIRPLYLIIKQNGKVEEHVGLAYANMLLSEQGQKLIEKAGYVPVRSKN